MSSNNPLAFDPASPEPEIPSKVSVRRLAALEEFYRRRCALMPQPDGCVAPDLRPLTKADVFELAGVFGGLLRGAVLRMQAFGFEENGDRWALAHRLEQFIRGEKMQKRR